MYDRAAVFYRRIDPSNGFGPLAVVTLHSSGIKGNKINLLFNSICQGNIARLIAILLYSWG
jgi:hypothetical protein